MSGASEIVLCTFNARYAHASLGLRCLMANLGALRSRASLLEVELETRPIDVLARLHELRPRVLALGVYIWNIEHCLELLQLLRSLEPGCTDRGAKNWATPWVILGGPEISYETQSQPITGLADFVIRGEGELAFAELCAGLLQEEAGSGPDALAQPHTLALGQRARASSHPGNTARIIDAAPPTLASLAPVDGLYSDEDLRHRVCYLEASRGCPFRCAFCASAIAPGLREWPVQATLASCERLWQRGARRFKFVDRSFNMAPELARALLEFFVEKIAEGAAQLHFELMPQQLDDGLLALMGQFAPGVLQLEVGVQTLNEAVAKTIRRPCSSERVLSQIVRLRQQTKAHLHTDLIVGLPGEDLQSFADGFDRLIRCEPQEIQVGILKRLRGAPINALIEAYGLRFSPRAPYEILATASMPFETIHRLRRFARLWDLVGNSGQFPRASRLLLGAEQGSAFERFDAFADWLIRRHPCTRGIALMRLMEFLFDYLSSERGIVPHAAAQALLDDYLGSGHNDVPQVLRPFLGADIDLGARRGRAADAGLAKRQRRHSAGG